MRRADPVPGRRQHRGSVGVQRGSRGARDSRQRDTGRDRHRPRNGLHHRRFCRRFPGADADGGSRAGEPRPRGPCPPADTSGGSGCGAPRCAGWRTRMQRLDYLSRRLTYPGERIRMQLAELGHLARRFVSGMRHELDSDASRARATSGSAWWPPRRTWLNSPPRTPTWPAACAHAGQRRLEIAAAAVSAAGAHLKHLSPQHVLDRGLQHHGNRRGSDRARRLQTRSPAKRCG